MHAIYLPIFSFNVYCRANANFIPFDMQSKLKIKLNYLNINAAQHRRADKIWFPVDLVNFHLVSILHIISQQLVLLRLFASPISSTANFPRLLAYACLYVYVHAILLHSLIS